MHARIISARYPRIAYASISTQIKRFLSNSMITNQLRLKNNSTPWRRQQWGETISDARFDHSTVKFDAVDMVLRQKIPQLSCMLQLSNNALGAQKSPQTDYACQALAKFGKIEATSRNGEKVYSWQAHYLAKLY